MDSEFRRNVELAQSLRRGILKFMKPSVALDLHRESIRRIVAAHRACNPRVFGSVLDGTDTENSDLDLLVDNLPGMTLLDIGGIMHELELLLGVRVDVLTPGSLPERFRHRVVAESRPL
jgi:predicted nucleotidyltransferase